MKAPVKLVLYLQLFLLITLFGCTLKPTMTDIRLDETYDGKQYEKILVIGAVEKTTFRNLLEAELVERLKNEGLEAFPSYVILPDKTKLTSEIIQRAIDESGIDSILIASFADSRKKEMYGAIEDSTPYLYYNGMNDVMHGAGKKSSADIETLFLKTNFYDGRSGKRLWSMTSGAEYRFTAKSLDLAGKLVVGKLKEAGLI